MRILISGSTGLVGSELIPLLQKDGHEVVRLVRSKKDYREAQIVWDPANGVLDGNQLEGIDAVIHLAGENVGEGRWTEKKKKEIRDSRIKSTNLLARKIVQLNKLPKVFICASAVGYYGDRKVTPLNEDASPGVGFLPRVCQEWENATIPLAEAGIRVANLRIGVVLSSKGGALTKMLMPFKMGVGGKIGSGAQYMSWISLNDVVGIIQHVLSDESLNGPINSVSPQPVTNQEFTKAMGRALKRPTIFPMPAFVARVAFGEMAQDLLLASTRVEPTKLQKSNYQFTHRNIDSALNDLLNE